MQNNQRFQSSLGGQMLNPEARILVIAAHADDESIGAGGVLMQHKGKKHVIVCTEPGGVRNNVSQMKQTLEEASEIGQFSYDTLEFPDQRLDTFNQIDLNQKLEKIIEEYKPDVIFTHSIHDNNTDHQFVHKAVLVAARNIQNLFFFHIPSPGEFVGFNPQAFYQIDPILKYRLLLVYDYEMRALPHPRSYQGLEDQAAVYGHKVGMDFAEAFEVGRVQL